MRRGTAIAEEAQAHQEEVDRKRSQGGNVQRFWLKGGEECGIIILDEWLEEGVAFYEHNLQDSEGKWSIVEPCVKDFGECPICARGANPYYVLMLSCLVLREFTTKKGQLVKWSKKLLPIKMSQFDMFQRLQNAAKEQGKSLRGMYLWMQRSATDDKAPRIGEPGMIDNQGRMFEIVPEEELDQEYGHDAIVGQDGRTIIRPENFDITPFEYDKVFPMPDANKLAQRYGKGAARPAAGSQDDAVKEFEEQQQTGGAEQPAAGSNRVRRRGEAPAPEPAPDEPQTAPAGRSRARGGGSAPAKTEAPTGGPATRSRGRNPFQQQ